MGFSLLFYQSISSGNVIIVFIMYLKSTLPPDRPAVDASDWPMDIFALF